MGVGWGSPAAGGAEAARGGPGGEQAAQGEGPGGQARPRGDGGGPRQSGWLLETKN